MPNEAFQPIAVRTPSKGHVLFFVRCLIDVQLGTIVKHLRPAMKELRGEILDVGAGESPWREWLPLGCTYRGIDVSDSDEYGMSVGRKDITYYDGTKMPLPSASFDGAICIEVLEHAKDPDLLMGEISRVLRSGSTLLLSVPWSARRHHIPHDYHRFTKERLVQLFAAHDFEDITVRERGSDIGVIANKLVVLTVRLLLPHRKSNAIWTLPLAALTGLMSAGMLVAAHLSELMSLGGKEDPLGYFVTARRAPAASSAAPCPTARAAAR